MIIKALKNSISKQTRKSLNRKKRALLKPRKQKVFGIGFNKTGTTSLDKAMSELGFKIGDQKTAEKLFKEYQKRNFSPIIKHSKTADFFQDFPFSFPYTYVVLDQNFKNSKFILTVRDSSEQWYNSITKFHSSKWGDNGTLPTKEDLCEAVYIFKGFPWLLNRIMFNTPEHNPYQKEIVIAAYERHIENVKDYFKDRPEALLVLNVSEKNAYEKLGIFLNIETPRKNFPWLKKTK